MISKYDYDSLGLTNIHPWDHVWKSSMFGISRVCTMIASTGEYVWMSIVCPKMNEYLQSYINMNQIHVYQHEY